MNVDQVDQIEVLARSSQYVIIARKLVALIEGNPNLSKDAMLKDTAQLLQLD